MRIAHIPILVLTLATPCTYTLPYAHLPPRLRTLPHSGTMERVWSWNMVKEKVVGGGLHPSRRVEISST
jgi:hypothetical protein